MKGGFIELFFFLAHRTLPRIHFQGFNWYGAEVISLINGVTLLLPGAWSALHSAGGCVGVFKLSHITLHSPSKQIYCMFTTNILKPADCMIACGLIILFVDLPTACPPADHNAGLFMKWNGRELLWTACNYTAPQISLMWATEMQNSHDSNKTPFD